MKNDPNWNLLGIITAGWFVMLALAVLLRLKTLAILLPLIMVGVIVYLVFCFVVLTFSGKKKEKDEHTG